MRLSQLIAGILLALVAHAEEWPTAETSSRLVEAARLVEQRGHEMYGVEARTVLVEYDASISKDYGGFADCVPWIIRINPYYAAIDPDFSVEATIPHEYAHLIMCSLYGTMGKDPHNEEWQMIMIGLGGNPYRHPKKR